MITVDTLSLQLPSGLGARAQNISQLVAEQLAQLSARFSGFSGDIEQLTIGDLFIHREYSDAQIAQSISQTITQAIGEQLQKHRGTEKPEKMASTPYKTSTTDVGVESNIKPASGSVSETKHSKTRSPNINRGGHL